MGILTHDSACEWGKERNDMDTSECTEVRLRALYPQKTCKRKGHAVYLVEENLCHIFHENLYGKTSSESPRIVDALCFRKGSRRSECVLK